MIATKQTILVTGVTGKQGGAVARHLVERGYLVRGLTRHRDKPEAASLRDMGIELVEGDMDDRTSLDAALQNAYGVFSVQDPWVAGLDAEVRFAQNLIDAAANAKVEHFVQSSVAIANHNTGIPHFDTKQTIEQMLHERKLPHTIIRPVFFMENWEMPMLRDAIIHGMLPQPLSPDTLLQQVAVDDIGIVTAMAFDEPGTWIGRAFDLAGDELSTNDTAATFTRVLDMQVKYIQVPWDEFEQTVGSEMAAMYRWFEDVGYTVDIAACRNVHAGVKDLETYLRTHEWAKAATSA